MRKAGVLRHVFFCWEQFAGGNERKVALESGKEYYEQCKTMCSPVLITREILTWLMYVTVVTWDFLYHFLRCQSAVSELRSPRCCGDGNPVIPT